MNSDFVRAVLDRVDAAVVACDAAAKLVVFNDAARKVYGSDTLPEHHPLFRAHREGAPVTAEITVQGSTVLVSAEPLFEQNQKIVGAVATCALLSASLQAQRRQSELLLESTGEGIYGIDLLGHCTFVNGSAAAMLGATPEDLLGKCMHKVMHHTDANGRPYPADNCPIHRAFREGRGCRIDDESFFRADGSSFPVEYCSYPILDQGAVRGAVVTFTDISARKRIEAALRESRSSTGHYSKLSRKACSRPVPAVNYWR